MKRTVSPGEKREGLIWLACFYRVNEGKKSGNTNNQIKKKMHESEGQVKEGRKESSSRFYFDFTFSH